MRFPTKMNIFLPKVLSKVPKSGVKLLRSIHLKSDRDLENVKPFSEIPGPPEMNNMGPKHSFPYGSEYKTLPEIYAYLHKTYGDLVKETIFDRTLVHVFDPDDMYEVYIHDGKYPRRKSHTALGRYRLDRPLLYDGPGIIPSNGEIWARNRNFFKRILLDEENCQNMLGSMEEVVDDLIESMQTNLDEKNEMDLQPLLSRWGLETINYLLFGRRQGYLSQNQTEAETLIEAAYETHLAVFETESFSGNEDAYLRLEKAQDLFAPNIARQMDEFMKSEEWHNKNCLLTKLLYAEGASQRDVFTILIDMHLGGIETSSFTLGYALYNLANNKSVQDTLRQELIRLLPNKDSRYVDIKERKHYLQAVMDETLRCTPITIGNGRITNADLVLSGYHVPKDTMVILQHQIACQSEKNFENAKSFKPERWIGLRKKFHIPSSPFGFGYRTCIGKGIAQRSILVALAKFVRNYEFSYHYEPMGTTTQLLNVPDKPLKLRLNRFSS